MKRLVSLLTLFSLITITASTAHAGEDWAQYGRYAAQNDSLRKNGTAPKAVFMGNSITEGWAGAHPKFFKEHNFVGRGISGQTTHQMLARFREDVVNLHPEIVVINGGTNDIAENNHTYNEEITFGNIVSMAEIAKANGIKVVLTSVLPAKKFKWRPAITDAPEKIKKLNARIKRYAEENGIPYVDYYSRMNVEDNMLNPKYTKDGVHPTAAGYDVMETLILPVISSGSLPR